MLGLAESRGQGRIGDTARCEALSIELVGPGNAHAFVERLTVLATVLLEIVHQPYDTIGIDWLEATGPHLGLEVPWVDELFVDRSTAREKVIASASGLLRQAEAAIDRIHSAQRKHSRAHLHHAIARLEHAQGDPRGRAAASSAL